MPADLPADTAAPPGVPASPPPGRSALAVVFLVVVIDLLGFGIVLPLLPRYAELYLTDATDTLKGVIIGGLLSVFSLMQFLLGPVWGRVSDRVGRRPVLVIGLAGSVVFYVLFAVASTVPASASVLALTLLFISRVGAGAAGATIGTAAAVIADSTPPEGRSRGMALIGAAFGIGFTFGPLIAAAALWKMPNDPWAPGAAAALLSAFALGLAIVKLPETLPAGPKPPRQFFSTTRTLEVLRQPLVGPVILVSFLAVFAFANFEGTLALLTQDALGLDKLNTSLVFAFIGVVLIVVQGGIYRPLATRRSEVQLLTLGILLMMTGLAGVAGVAIGADLFQQAGGGPPRWLTPLFYFSIAVGVSGFAFTNPSTAGLISRRTDPARQGEVLGVSQAVSAMGRILGPFLGALIYFRSPAHAGPYLLAVFVLGGVFALLPAVRRGSPAAGSA